MDITVSSMLTMCLYNSILILLLCWLFKKDSVLAAIGPKWMIGLLGINIFRMYFPLEFPFTKSIYIENVLSPFRSVLNYSIIIEPVNITVWRVLMAVWVVVAGVLFILRVVKYGRLMRYVSRLETHTLDEIIDAYSLDAGWYQNVRDIKVVYGKQYKSPYLVGVRKGYLLMPNMEYEQKNIRYILEHEMMHVRKKDVVWKILIDLLYTFFWWNPVMSYLKKELFRLIELRNDMEVVSHLTDEESVEYMECLRDMAVMMSGKAIAFGVAFSRSDFKDLKQRMKLIVDSKQTVRWMQICLSGVVAALLMVGACIIIEPTVSDEIVKQKVEEDEGGDVEITVGTIENTFLVKNGEQYDVYLDGEYVFTTDDLSGFRDVEIYNTLEVKENE